MFDRKSTLNIIEQRNKLLLISANRQETFANVSNQRSRVHQWQAEDNNKA
jgi:hypothetical protein